MARGRKVDEDRREPDWPLERGLLALRKQLRELDKLNGRRLQEARAEETQWEHLTQSIIEHTFGNPSSNLSKFYQAGHAGTHIITDYDDGGALLESNFQERLVEYDSLLRSLIAELEMSVPDTEIKGAYGAADEYEFYRDLGTLITSATNTLFIVDAYLDEKVFTLYLDKVPPGVSVRVLTNKVAPNVEAVAKMYAKCRPLELRSSSQIHDRLVFVDDRCWAVGQSIKDAAKKKPTYLGELQEPAVSVLRAAHDTIWNSATSVV